MPQLDLNTYYSQIFWLIITFIPLLLFFSFIILPGLKKTLDNRDNTIKDYIESAKILHAKAEDIKINYEAALKKSKIDAEKIINEAKENVRIDSEKKNAELQEKFNKEMKDLEYKLNNKIDDLKLNFENNANIYANIILNNITNIKDFCKNDVDKEIKILMNNK